jgi:hypothetical protein
MRKHGYLVTSLALVGTGFCPGLASATSITINNPSFESPSCPGDPFCGGGDYTVDALTDWNPGTVTGQYGAQLMTTGEYTAGSDGLSPGLIVPDGSQGAYLNAGATIDQVLTSTLAAGTYTLTFYAGERADYNPNLPITAYLIAGTDSQSLSVNTIGVGQWVQETLTDVVSASDPNIGQLIELEFVAQPSPGAQTDLDDVALNFQAPVSATPLPATMPLFVGRLSLFGGLGYWRMRRDKVDVVENA